MARPGRGEVETRSGGLPRPSAVYFVSLSADGYSSCVFPFRIGVPLPHPEARSTADNQDWRLHRCGLCRHAVAVDPA